MNNAVVTYSSKNEQTPNVVSAFSESIKDILGKLELNKEVFIPFGKKTILGQKGYTVEKLDTHTAYQQSSIANFFKDHDQSYIAYQRPGSKEIVSIEVITQGDAVRYIKIILFPNKKSARKRLNGGGFTGTEIYDVSGTMEYPRVPDQTQIILKELRQINLGLITKVEVLDTNVKEELHHTLLLQ